MTERQAKTEFGLLGLLAALQVEQQEFKRGVHRKHKVSLIHSIVKKVNEKIRQGGKRGKGYNFFGNYQYGRQIRLPFKVRISNI